MFINFVVQGLEPRFRDNRALQQEIEDVLKNCFKEEITECKAAKQKIRRISEDEDELTKEILKRLTPIIEGNFDNFEVLFKQLPEDYEEKDNIRLVIRPRENSCCSQREVLEGIEVVKRVLKNRIFRLALTLEEEGVCFSHLDVGVEIDSG